MPPRTKRKKAPRPVFNRPPPNNPYLIGVLLGFFALGVLALVFLAVDAVMGGHKEYLYHVDGEDDSSSPVVEYQEKGRDRLKPDFLVKPTSGDFSPGPRVVEFYAPWCPHCQHYAPKYKKLAEVVMEKHPSIKFYAVSCVAHSALCKNFEVKSYPTIKVFKEGSYEGIKGGTLLDEKKILDDLGLSGGSVDGADGDGGNAEAKREEAKKKLENMKKRVRKGGTSTVNSSDGKEHARVVPFRDHDVHDAWSDAATSFEFALQNGIYMENGPLAPEKSKAFKEWLELLSKTLPGEMARTHDIVDGLLKNYARALKGQGELDELVGELVSNKRTWVWRTCTYGDAKVGYTCGLWQLFHVMSVGVVEYNRHNPPISTLHASETLRNYIDNFFQCDVCRMNFLSMYDTCAFDGCHRLSENPSLSEREWKELPMWLWETHNDVNVRLLGERMEQYKQDKPSQFESQQARWPALFACPNCWREDRSWEEDEVFKYLHKQYWTGNPSYLKIPSSDGPSKEIGSGSRGITLRWKMTIIVFAVAALILRLFHQKKVRRYSGKHKR